MASTLTSTSSSSGGGGSPRRRWLDERTGLDAVLHVALDEPIPGGARWAYVFGSGLLLLFLSQILTGIALALYYVPAANDAHITVAYIVKAVSGGAFLRSLHSYGASAFIVVLLLHIIQTFFYGAYKGRRELVWLSGCTLLALILGMSFTGYLLPWDQRAYFATAVGTNVMGEMPGAGNLLKQLLRGGNQMGTVTLTRFFVLHVFVLPGLLIALIASHVYLFRVTGPAGPPSEDPVHPTSPTETFYPRQFGRDLIFGVLLITAIAALAYFYPVRLGPEANPADTAFIARPEWYFLPLFEWLKFWPGQSALVGVVILPAVVTLLFVGVPFLDRGLKRHPFERPIAVGGFCFVLAGLVGFGVLSKVQDGRDPAVSAQMVRQERATEAFMRAPFVPLEIGKPASASASAPILASAPGSIPSATPQQVSSDTPPGTPPAQGGSATPPAQPKPPAGGNSSSAPGAKQKAAAPATANPGSKGSSADAKPPAPPANPGTPPKPNDTPAPAASQAPADSALIAKGSDLFHRVYKCTDCHGDNGEGGDQGPKLAGIGSNRTVDDLTAFLHKPSSMALGAGMPQVDSDDEIKALIAYVLSLKP